MSSSSHSPSFQSLHLRHSSFSNPSIVLPMSQIILQPFHCFTYVTAHSPTLLLLHLCHSSFSNPSVASSMSQLILQPFFCFSFVTGFLLTSPGEPPIVSIVRTSNYIFVKFVHSSCNISREKKLLCYFLINLRNCVKILIIHDMYYSLTKDYQIFRWR